MKTYHNEPTIIYGTTIMESFEHSGKIMLDYTTLKFITNDSALVELIHSLKMFSESSLDCTIGDGFTYTMERGNAIFIHNKDIHKIVEYCYENEGYYHLYFRSILNKSVIEETDRKLKDILGCNTTCTGVVKPANERTPHIELVVNPSDKATSAVVDMIGSVVGEQNVEACWIVGYLHVDIWNVDMLEILQYIVNLVHISGNTVWKLEIKSLTLLDRLVKEFR